jgi:two-component system nitrate/nitrite response regulator NarL
MQPKVAIHHRSKLLQNCIERILEARGFQVVVSKAPLGGTLGGEHDILIMDFISLKGADEAALARLTAAVKVVVIADEFFLSDLKVAMRVGARGFLLSRLAPDAFVLSLRLVQEGEKVFPSELVGTLFSKELTRSIYGDVFEPKAAEAASLAAGVAAVREPFRSILELVGRGYSNRSIAEMLNTPEALVKFLLKSFMRQVGVVNRTQAAVWAVRMGLTAEVEASETVLPTLYGLKPSAVEENLRVPA